MPNDTSSLRCLDPLLALAPGGGAARIVAGPGSVFVDRPFGTAPAVLAWDEYQHSQAVECIGDNVVTLGSGATARVVDSLVVLNVPPRSDERSDNLVRNGVMSPLAARTVSAALGVGCNVLVVGPWLASVPLVAAFAADGCRPVVMGHAGDCVPSGWPLVGSIDQASTCGADRTACWSLTPHELGAVMRRACGVVGWIDARRLDRALMRLEIGFDANDHAALQVLAALDVVVVVSATPIWHVTAIAEIVLVADGYRPRLVFATGLAPLPSALVPVDVPSFVSELAQGGFGVLADELRHAVPTERVVDDSRASGRQRVSPPDAPKDAKSQLPIVEYEEEERSPATALVAEQMQGLRTAAPVPGWELDRLEEQGPPADSQDGGATTSAEEASLAATYGLGPPPRPASLRGSDTSSFDAALQRLKDHDFES